MGQKDDGDDDAGGGGGERDRHTVTKTTEHFTQARMYS